MVIFAKSKPNHQNRFCSQLLQSTHEDIDAYNISDCSGIRKPLHVAQCHIHQRYITQCRICQRHIANHTPMDSNQDRIQNSPKQQQPHQYF
jgi:hypothetical protein